MGLSMETIMDRVDKVCEKIWKLIEGILSMDFDRILRYLPLLIILVVGLYILPKLQWLIDIAAYAWLCLEVTATRSAVIETKRMVENDIAMRTKDRRG
jgi:hypothetical protein